MIGIRIKAYEKSGCAPLSVPAGRQRMRGIENAGDFVCAVDPDAYKQYWRYGEEFASFLTLVIA